MSPAEQLIEDVIFQGKHTEIYDSLEKTLRNKYIVSTKEENLSEKDGILAIIYFFIGAQMDNADNYCMLTDDIKKEFEIKIK